MTPVLGEDGIVRCPWAGRPGLDRDYHDNEWGRRVYGESAYFERLTLEAFQSGLSWSTILRKREGFRELFLGFDADAVAAFGADDAERLMGDARIVRNRAKINAAIINARAVIELRAEGGLEEFVLSFAPGESPAWHDADQVPSTSPESVALAKGLKRRGFGFVGPTTMYALMQAIGVFDPHLAGCFTRVGAGHAPLHRAGHDRVRFTG